MNGTLPINKIFEILEKEARKLLRDLQRKNVAATERYRPFDVLDTIHHARLADAQYIIARRYGFRSWTNLREHLVVGRTKTK